MPSPFPLSPQLFVGCITVLVMIHVILGIIPFLIYLERKISAYIQDRIGPNRVGFDLGLPLLKTLTRGFGFWGLGQSLADGLKFILKEDYRPFGADKWLFTLAPACAVVPAFVGWAIIPWGGHVSVPEINLFGANLVSAGTALVAVADINIGFVFLLAVAAVGVYGVTLGGWASNNKYSFLGGLRCSAGMISYEIPMGLSILAVLLVTGTVRPSLIVEQQISSPLSGTGGWLFLAQPLACLLFYTCILAEANRAPFDNAEAEQELVGGYHTEYSAMRFALFFLAEYAHMMTSSAFCVVLFFGGYHVPGLWLTYPEETGLLAVLVKVAVLVTKVLLSVCFMMVIRWTIPRIRYDQVLKLCWQSLIPASITLVVATSIMVYQGWTATWQLFVMNVLVGGAMIALFPLLPKADVNKRLPMAGSRFNPLPGEPVITGPVGGIARADDPIGGLAGSAFAPSR
ncbi:MAG: NADH-quinone oxidoreductase subunit H [Phycisphaerae bacterium]|nr:NADH-quinone oxidoreductase subunit H [Phycisphaerae bacterium]